MPPVKIPQKLPGTVYAGDTLYFIESNQDYKSTSGWSLVYEFSPDGPANITSSSTASGDYLFDIATSITDYWAPGDYTWRSYVTKNTSVTSGTPPVTTTTTERYPVLNGVISIRDSSYVSVAKKKIDAIKAYLSNTTTYADYEWTMKSLGDMTVSRGGNPRKEAREDLAYWKTVYAAEVQKERIEAGIETNDKTVWAKFTKN